MFNKWLRYALVVGLLAGAAFLLVSLVGHSINPPPISRSWLYGDTAIDFSADQEAIVLPWQCVTVRWKLNQFRAITLKGVPQGGSGEMVVCPDYREIPILNIHHFMPILSVDLVSGKHEDFPLAIDVIPFNIVNWFHLTLAIILTLLAGRMGELPWISSLSRRAVKMTSVQHTMISSQAKLSGWMGYIFTAINIVFIVFNLLTIGKVTFWLAAPLIFVAMLLAAASLNSRVQRWVGHLMMGRYMVFSPVLWFVASVLFLDNVIERFVDPVLWSGVQVWHAMIFLWLCVFWLASYALRRFTFDRSRRFAWLTLPSIAVLVCVAGFLLPYVRLKYDWAVFHTDQIPSDTFPMLAAVADQNTDSIHSYIPPTRAFPWVWRSFGWILHRPGILLMSSQVCQVTDAILFGYLNGDFLCTIQGAVIALWTTNIAVYMLCMLLVYELLRACLKDPRVAWMGAALAVICVVNAWYVFIPSTDYAEMIIAIGSLWVLYHLLIVPRATMSRVILAGALLGTMLLFKLNGTYLIFGTLMSIGMKRWRALLATTLIPITVWIFYTQLVQAFGIPYYIQEMEAGYPSVNWLWRTFIYYTPYQMIRSLSMRVGHTADMVTVLFGFLTVVGVYVMIANKRYPRAILVAAWTLFLSIAAFAWVFTYTYVTHVLGLLPFMYGAVALGIDSVQMAVRERFVSKPRLGSIITLALWVLVVSHNLLQWGAWQNRHLMNYFAPF